MSIKRFHSFILQAKMMFDGELEGLKAIVATDTVQVPVPIIALNNPRSGAVLVMEYLDMKGLHTYSKQLGEDLAKYDFYYYFMQIKMHVT
jgi:fructosamine-3-kinase